MKHRPISCKGFVCIIEPASGASLGQGLHCRRRKAGGSICLLRLVPNAGTGRQGAYVIVRSDNHPVAGELRGQLAPAVFKLTSGSSSS